MQLTILVRWSCRLPCNQCLLNPSYNPIRSAQLEPSPPRLRERWYQLLRLHFNPIGTSSKRNSQPMPPIQLLPIILPPQLYYGISFCIDSFPLTPPPYSSPRAATMPNSASFMEDLEVRSPTVPCSHYIAGDSNPLSAPVLSTRRCEFSLVAQESPSILKHEVSSTAQDPPIIPSETLTSAISAERSPIDSPPVCKPSVVSVLPSVCWRRPTHKPSIGVVHHPPILRHCQISTFHRFTV